jgi:uncharacterized protein YndB with AHSA1/START domain
MTLMTAAKPPAADVLTLTRSFDAPRGGVFRAWTDPERLARWWGPRHFANPVCELDARPDGAIRIHMRAPGGSVHPLRGMFHDVEPPERLALTMIAEDDSGRILIETFITAAFSERGTKTTVALQVRVVQCAPEFAAARAGMADGWSQSLDRLTAYLRTA